MEHSVSSLPSPTNVRHVRSISFPGRSHPITLQLEEEISYLKTLEASSSSMVTIDTACNSVFRLERLYTSINDLLSLQQTQQPLSHRKNEKLVDELLDRSVSLLDVCGSMKDVVEHVKEELRNVQSALRRKTQGLNIDASSFKKMKAAKRSILSLKQIDKKIGGIALLDVDHHLSIVIRSLRDTTAMSVAIFRSILTLKSIFTSKPKSSKWSAVSTLFHQGKKISVDQPQILNEVLESHIEVIENSLEGMFRTLIKTRVFLLNIRSH